MQTKYKVIIVVAVLATTFALGRYTVPTSVKTEIETSSSEKKTDNKQTESEKNKHKDTTIVEVTKPDGTKETTTHVIEDTNSNRKTDTSSTDEIANSSKHTTEITRDGARVNISVLAGSDLKFAFPPTTGTIIYGGHATKEILGPITIGAWGLSNGTGGLSLGLSF